MATLNIKNFPDDLYAEIKEQSRRDRRSVAQEVIYLLELARRQPESRSILDLRELGRTAWGEVDAGAFVASQRDEWE